MVDQQLNWKRNIKLYQWINYTLPFVLFWALAIPYYRTKGLDFTQIAVLQTIGAVMNMAFEIPFGWYSDRYGYRKTLLISCFGYIGGIIFLIFGQQMSTLVISEFFFALAMAAKSGADTAIFYGSLELLGQTEDYLQIRSRITQKESIIRFFIRILAPVLYSFITWAPFALSLIPYGLVTLFTFQYTELPQREIGDSTAEPNQGSFLKKLISNIKTFFSLNLPFTLLSIFSMLMIVLVSNYSQFFAPYLESVGVDIKFYGVITASSMVATFLGARWIGIWKKTPSFLALTLCGSLICLFLAIFSRFNACWSAVLFYFVMNLLETQFGLYLSKSLNQVIPSHRRATMLSFSNIFDQIGSIICDPLIGFGLDQLGFKNIYTLLGLIGCLTFFILWIILKKLGYSTYHFQAHSENQGNGC